MKRQMTSISKIYVKAWVVMALIALFATNALGQTKWTKYEGNPVLDLGGPGTWDDYHVSVPSVLFEDGEYKIWYTGHDGSRYRIGYATSTDGIVWTKYEGNPVLDLGPPGSWDDYHVSNVSVLFEDGTYKMWYTGYDSSRHRIGYATSPDGITWTKYAGNPVLDLGAPGEWDDYHVSNPFVLFEDGTYKMWYTGYDSSRYRIGYATSPDGIVWTKYEDNPVLDLGAPGEWDDNWVYDPSVLFEDGVYKMWYAGDDGSNRRIGYATSTDGIVWTKYEDNPVLDLGPPGSWDDYVLDHPSVLFEDGIYKMWYSGNDGSQDRIGYATSAKRPCSAMVVTSDANELSSLRQFRDNVLVQNEMGQALTDMYYYHSSEVAQILLSHPGLSIRSAVLLREIMPGIYFLLGREDGVDIVLTTRLVSRIQNLVWDISDVGSDELANTLFWFSDWLNGYKRMRVSEIWRAVGEE